jgi:hypothetical protein
LALAITRAVRRMDLRTLPRSDGAPLHEGSIDATIPKDISAAPRESSSGAIDPTYSRALIPELKEFDDGQVADREPERQPHGSWRERISIPALILTGVVFAIAGYGVFVPTHRTPRPNAGPQGSISIIGETGRFNKQNMSYSDFGAVTLELNVLKGRLT